MASNITHDDTFQLYDLRVEVVCPPGKRIMCGAKEGDHFILQGEMLYLPQGQGMSIYSLGTDGFIHAALLGMLILYSCSPPTACSEAAHDSQERLDHHRCTDRVPRPRLPLSVEDFQRSKSHV